mgnify:FL=1
MALTTRSAIASSVVGRYFTLALQFISTMLLARLLTPEDIGIYSAGFSIVALAHLFRDFGLNQYIIQEKSLDDTKVSTTFTISLLIAWTFGLTIYCIAGLVSDFFNEDGVKSLLHLLSFNFLIIPFGSITLALLRKKLLFHITAFIGFLATLIGITITLWTAYDGARYMSLAYGAIAETSSIVILSSFYRSKDFKFTLSLVGAREIFKFGSIVGAGNIITQFTNSAAQALIARLLGLSSLGFFSRATGTSALFDNMLVSSVKPTVLPLLSNHNKDLEKLTVSYLKVVSIAFIFAWPFFTFLFLYTHEIINFLYGSQWDTAVPLVKILCIVGMLRPPMLFADNLFIAYGRPNTVLKIITITNLIKLALIACACFVDLEAVCYALLIASLVRLFLVLKNLNFIFHMHTSNFVQLGIKAFPTLVLTITPAILADLMIGTTVENNFIRLPILMACSFIGWLAGLALSKHVFYDELTLLLKRKK